MHARVRRQLIDEMMGEHGEPLVHSLVDAIMENTDKSITEAADIVLTGWQRSKDSADVNVETLVNLRTYTLYHDVDVDTEMLVN
jgi:hypothetical protein